MSKPVFALSSDYQYITQITTTIKSILYHNPDAQVNVINTDIPQEWFANINNRLHGTKAHLNNLRIADDLLKAEHVSQPQITKISYGRILIPKLIDEKRVLYLDSDIIVTGNLNELFQMDMGDHPIAAVPDFVYHLSHSFNSGVILFNMPLIKWDTDLVSRMLQFGLDKDLPEGDQSVLNHFFRQSYLHLPSKYNLPLGYDFFFNRHVDRNPHFFEQTSDVHPKIIHFPGVRKPWKQFSVGRQRQLWWQYHDLTWSDVVNHRPLPPVIDYPEQKRALISTYSQNVEHLEDLAKAFPNLTIDVASWTQMGNRLTKLITYSNLHLHPAIIRVEMQRLVDSADFYLDINTSDKDDPTIDKFIKTGKPMLSFDDVNSKAQGADNYRSFSSLSQMKTAIQQLMK